MQKKRVREKSMECHSHKPHPFPDTKRKRKTEKKTNKKQTRLLAEQKANEMQSFADRKNIKKFFEALKLVYGPKSSRTTPLPSADGTSILNDKGTILKRWAEHFDGVLNRPSSIYQQTTTGEM